MKFNETQKNLIALLPAHEIINKLTDSAKLVLAQIDLLHGTDFAMENGYVFTTNEQLCKDTGIRARQTVITAVKVLRKLKLIELESGGRHKANRYKLTDLYYELSGDENPFKNQAKECENQAKEMVPKNKNQAVDIDIEIEPELEIIQDTIVHVTEDKIENTMNDINKNETDLNGLLYDEDAYEVLNMEPNWDEIERDNAEFLQWMNENSASDTHNNDYVTWAFDWLSDNLRLYHNTNSEVTSKYYCNSITNFLNNLDETKFTPSQWRVIEGKMDTFVKIAENKDNYLNKVKKAVSNENIISNGTSGSVNIGGCAAPKYRNTDEDNEKILRQLCSDEELIAMGFEVEEPMVAYGNNSVKEAQQQFAMVLAANG